MNLFAATGRVGRANGVRSAGGSDVLSFALAVDSGYGDSKQTLWFDCSIWGKRAASLDPHISKGDLLAVSGELSQHEKDGKTYLKLRVAEVTLLGGKKEADKPKPAPPKPTPAKDAPRPQGGAVDDDDIPFAPYSKHYTF